MSEESDANELLADIAYALLERAVYAPEDWKIVATLEDVIITLKEWMREENASETRVDMASEILDIVVTNLLYLRKVEIPTDEYIEGQARLFREMLNRANDEPKKEEE